MNVGKAYNVLIVGDGFIRPEVCTFVNSGRITCINAGRGNLGTDKSVPYENPRQTHEAKMCKSNTDSTDLRGFYLARFFIRIIRINSCLIAFL